MASRPPKRSKSAARKGVSKLTRGTGRFDRLWPRLNLQPRWLSWTVLGLVFAFVVARLSGVVWLGAVAKELGFQLCLCALVLGAVAAWQRAWPALAACSLLVLAWGVPLYSLARSTRPTPSTGPTLRVLSSHLGSAASPVGLSPAELLTDLVSHKIDVAVLTAFSPAALASLGQGDTLRNYRALHSTSPSAPWLLFVRRDLAASTRAPKANAGARVRVGSCDVTVQAVNVPSLFTYGERQARQRELRALREARRDARSLWLGHLGSLPSASDVQPLLDAQELRDGRLGYGRLPSAPAALGVLGVPLEHLLVHGWLRVTTLAVDEPLAPQAQGTLRATIELTEPGCRVQP